MSTIFMALQIFDLKFFNRTFFIEDPVFFRFLMSFSRLEQPGRRLQMNDGFSQPLVSFKSNDIEEELILVERRRCFGLTAIRL
jgi:hypothetical protein